MTDPTGPYRAVYAATVHDQARALPKAARVALADALDVASRAPWLLHRYHDRMPPEMRTLAFANWGFAVVVISDRRRLLIVAHITWVGAWDR